MEDAIDPDQLLELYRQMLRIRRFEEQVALLYQSGDVPGFVHLSVGQEATAVGGCWPLRPDDYLASTHRGHGHCLAKGMEMAPMLAELFGRESGACAGRGGSMHIADPSVGMLGANGIVGAGLPIAVGAAFAAQRRGDGVSVAFFGDGAVATGAFHEAVNLAALWRLPVIFFCENNGYAEFSATATQHPAPIVGRASGTASMASSWMGPMWSQLPNPCPPSSKRCTPAVVRSLSRPTPTGGTATTRAIR